MMDFVAIGNNLKRIRCKLGLTQEELAEQCNIATETVSRIECGKKGFSVEVCCLLANALRCTPNDILGYCSSGTGEILKDLQSLIEKYQYKNDLAVSEN